MASRGEGGTSAGTDRETPPMFQATSSLVGVPMGVLQQRGGLAFCVAAVVERAGDVSVLVGGATVCQLSGKACGAVCAAAVSAETGVLVDARAFLLRNEANSLVITEWLDDLPDGVVVVVAAGGAANTATCLDPVLAEAMAKLVCNGHSDAEQSAKPQPGKSTAWSLLGWKGNGNQHWARCQRGSSGSGKRCALYAELLLTLPHVAKDRASGTGPEPAQIELKDKLCLCPLNSLQSQTEAASGDSPSLRCTELPASAASVGVATGLPGRGQCFREGELAVSVGPTIDVVDCVGWTTVLLTPEDCANADVAISGEEKVAAWAVAAVSAAVGGWHEDTMGFDDGVVG